MIMATPLLEWVKLVGFFWPIAFFALLFVLQKHFPTKGEFAELKNKLDALSTVAVRADDAAHEAMHRAEALEKSLSHRWERTTETLERVSRAMELIAGELKDVVEKQSKLNTEQAVQGEKLGNLIREFDNHNKIR